MSLAYVGSNSVHVSLNANDINQPVPGPGANNPRRQFPRFADILMSVPLGGANYQALEAKFERRFSGGFSILSGYTFSKTLESQIGQLTSVLAPEKRLSFQHLPHRFFTAACLGPPIRQGPAVALRRRHFAYRRRLADFTDSGSAARADVHSHSEWEPGEHDWHSAAQQVARR